MGVFKRFGVRILGTPIRSIIDSEDRKIFAERVAEIGEQVAPSVIVENMEDALRSESSSFCPSICFDSLEPDVVSEAVAAVVVATAADAAVDTVVVVDATSAVVVADAVVEVATIVVIVAVVAVVLVVVDVVLT